MTTSAELDEHLAQLIHHGYDPQAALAALEAHHTADAVLADARTGAENATRAKVDTLVQLFETDQRSLLSKQLSSNPAAAQLLVASPWANVKRLTQSARGPGANEASVARVIYKARLRANALPWQLVKLGYSKERAELALSVAKGDENEAATWLLCSSDS
jgi:type IV pilus biogenesis protein CpaD/CtpE